MSVIFRLLQIAPSFSGRFSSDDGHIFRVVQNGCVEIRLFSQGTEYVYITDGRLYGSGSDFSSAFWEGDTFVREYWYVVGQGAALIGRDHWQLQVESGTPLILQQTIDTVDGAILSESKFRMTP